MKLPFFYMIGIDDYEESHHLYFWSWECFDPKGFETAAKEAAYHQFIYHRLDMKQGDCLRDLTDEEYESVEQPFIEKMEELGFHLLRVPESHQFITRSFIPIFPEYWDDSIAHDNRPLDNNIVKYIRERFKKEYPDEFEKCINKRLIDEK